MWWEGFGWVPTVLVYDDEGRAEELILRCLVALCYAGVENLVQLLHPQVWAMLQVTSYVVTTE